MEKRSLKKCAVIAVLLFIIAFGCIATSGINNVAAQAVGDQNIAYL